MTPAVNFLPWREWERRRRNGLFLLQLGGVLAAGLVVVGALAVDLSGAIAAQQARNASLRGAIDGLNERVAEMHRLEQRRDDLLQRIKGMQALEANRAATVRLFDELASRLPEEAHYQAVALQGDVLALTGMAASSGVVAALVRNLNRSAWFEQANLVSIEEPPEGAAYGAGAGVFHLTVVRVDACLTEGVQERFDTWEGCS